MTIELCVVSGTVVAPDGSPMPNVTVQFRPAPLTVRARGASAVAPSPVTVVSGADAGLSVALAPGVYTVRAREDRGREYQPFLVDVPAKPEADLSSILFDLPPPQSVYDAAASAHTAVQAAESVLAARNEARQFAGRASLVTAVQAGAELPDGVIATADGIAWRAVSGATAIPDLPGLVPVEPARPEHWGAVGDGIADDREALTAALAWGGHVVAGGRYGVRGTVAPLLSRDTRFEIEGQIVVLEGFPAGNKVIWPQEPLSPVSLAIHGGVIDGRRLPPRPEGTAPDLLYLNRSNLRMVRLEGTHYVCNDDLTGTAGDSCVFLSSSEDFFVLNNVFQGAAVDAGLYISANNAGVGRRAVVCGNVFRHCSVAVISKRGFEEHVVQGNIVEDCQNGIVIGGEVDANSVPGGRYATIAGNTLRRCIRGIEARLADRTSIVGNVLHEMGGTSADGAGIVISGSTGCIVAGNTVEAATGVHVAMAGVLLRDRTVNSVPYHSTHNLIGSNAFTGCPTAIRETGGSDANNVQAQMVHDGNSTATLIGPNSQFGVPMFGSTSYFLGAPGNPTLQIDALSNGQSWVRLSGQAGSTASLGTAGAGDNVNLTINPKGSGVTLIGGPLNQEGLRVRKGGANSTAVEIVPGASTGAAAEIRTRGSGNNIDLALLPKGNGMLSFGTYTSSASATVNGYIQVRDVNGVIRKLAVID